MSPAPLKRHASLIPLSRDHYGGLVQARRLRLAADGNAAARLAALRALLDEWRTQISDHFDDEERLLTPLLDDRSLVARLYADHEHIRERIERARHAVDAGVAPDPSWLREFGQVLHDHIRWEERECFPAVEQAASPEELHKLTAETEQIEHARPRWSRASRNAQSSSPRPMPR